MSANARWAQIEGALFEDPLYMIVICKYMEKNIYSFNEAKTKKLDILGIIIYEFPTRLHKNQNIVH